MAGFLLPEEFTRMRRSLLARSAVTTAPVAVFASAYFALWQPPYGNYSWLIQLFVNIGEAFAYLAVVVLVGNIMFRRRWLARHEGWAVEGRPITEADRNDLAAVPTHAARACFATTFATLTAGVIADAATGVAAPQVVGYGIFWFLLAFTFASIVYLQTEAALRPLYARAFETSLPDRATVTVMPRLAISWAVGSAVPLLLVAIIPLRPASHRDLPVVAPMLLMALGGVFVGGITAIVAARSVAEPVEEVRAGLERVREGDIEEAVVVTRPGDLGALEVGFNSMLDAMRSRRHLQDLFGRHVGEEVAGLALQNGVELGGELRQASVLFVDIIGSSALAEQLPPQSVVAHLNSFFEAVVDEVGERGGWVNKFEGDGCLCVFGAPISFSDHAARALQAARLLRHRLCGLGIDAALGVSSGEVVAGNVGAARRFEYTVIGRPVNEAARLTEAAKSEPGRVLASRQAVESAGAEAGWWAGRGPLDLRGIREAVETAVPAPRPT